MYKAPLGAETQEVLHSGLFHPPHSPDVGFCDFWLFGTLNGILKDPECSLNDEIKEGIALARNDFTFGGVRSVFRDWMTRLEGVAKNGREYNCE
jgi:hypothetical protein